MNETELKLWDALVSTVKEVDFHPQVTVILRFEPHIDPAVSELNYNYLMFKATSKYALEDITVKIDRTDGNVSLFYLAVMDWLLAETTINKEIKI